MRTRQLNYFGLFFISLLESVATSPLLHADQRNNNFNATTLIELCECEVPEGDKKLAAFQKKTPLIYGVWPKGPGPDEPQPDLEEKVIDKGDGILRITGVTLPTLHYWPASKPDGRAVIIFPGGGYNILAADHEGVQIAKWLNTQGISAFILKYRVPRRKNVSKHAVALPDAQRAIRLVREHADEFKIDPDQIGVIGFSAGGNLAALTVHHAAKPSYEKIDDVDTQNPKPNFAILIYPAYLNATRSSLEMALEFPPLKSAKDHVPTFITVASDDKHGMGVLPYTHQLMQAKVPVALHIYAKGGHGKGLLAKGYPFSQWAKACEQWLEDMKPSDCD